MINILVLIVIVALIGGGVRTLISGRISATSISVVEGTPARVIGLLLVLAIPCAFAAGGVASVILSSHGLHGEKAMYFAIVPLVGFPILAAIIGFLTAKPITAGREREHEQPSE